MHPHLAEILRTYLRRVGRAGGLLSTSGRRGRGGLAQDAGRDRHAGGFAAGDVRTRRFRTSSATHRCTCDGVDANTVRMELGHSDLQLLASTYARAQRTSDRMGAEFSYRLDRWGGAVEAERLERVAA